MRHKPEVSRILLFVKDPDSFWFNNIRSTNELNLRCSTSNSKQTSERLSSLSDYDLTKIYFTIWSDLTCDGAIVSGCSSRVSD